MSIADLTVTAGNNPTPNIQVIREKIDEHMYGEGGHPTVQAHPLGAANTHTVHRGEIPGWMQYTETKHGSGELCYAGTVITCNYTGKDKDGKVFDTNHGRIPFQFVYKAPYGAAADSSICWEKAFEQMTVGTHAIVTCPSMLAGEDKGYPDHQTLTFELELISC